jgi:hypothetical protein
MPKKSIILLAALLIAAKANADIVEYELNCEGSYTVSQNWTADFDLGIIFSEISHIYLDWSGSITAVEFEPIYHPMPIFQPYYDGYFRAELYEFNSTSSLAHGSVSGGQETAPSPESFDFKSEFYLNNYSPFLDGVGSIKIEFRRTHPLLWYIDPPIIRIVSDASGQLDPAKLIFDGTIIPEPATLLFLAFGALTLRKKRFCS